MKELLVCVMVFIQAKKYHQIVRKDVHFIN